MVAKDQCNITTIGKTEYPQKPSMPCGLPQRRDAFGGGDFEILPDAQAMAANRPGSFGAIEEIDAI
ncbi:MAG: hypothetical protein C0485_16930 [Pirellula sp.]|nr:hypothetical protein [Pirellula sp.]